MLPFPLPIIAVKDLQDNANNFIFDLRRSYVTESRNTQSTKEGKPAKLNFRENLGTANFTEWSIW